MLHTLYDIANFQTIVATRNPIKLNDEKTIFAKMTDFDNELMKYCVYTGSSLANDIMAENNFKPSDRDYFLIDETKMQPLCQFLSKKYGKNSIHVSNSGSVLSFSKDHDCMTYQIINAGCILNMFKCDETQGIAELLSLFDTDYTKCAMYNGKIYILNEFMHAMLYRECYPVTNSERRKTMKSRGFTELSGNYVCPASSFYDKKTPLCLATNDGIIKFSKSNNDSIIVHNLNNNGKCFCVACEKVVNKSQIDNNYCAKCHADLYHYSILNVTDDIIDHDAIVLSIYGILYSFKRIIDANEFCVIAKKFTIYEVIHRGYNIHPICFGTSEFDKEINIKLPAQQMQNYFDNADITTLFDKNVLRESFKSIVTSHVIDDNMGIDERYVPKIGTQIKLFHQTLHYFVTELNIKPKWYSKEALIDALIKKGTNIQDIQKIIAAIK